MPKNKVKKRLIGINSYLRIFLSILSLWNILVFQLFYNRILVLFPFKFNLLVIFYTTICIPCLISFLIYIVKNPTANTIVMKKFKIMFLVLSSAIILYSFYFIYNCILHTDVIIKSEKIITRANFVKKRSFLPLLPHKQRHSFLLERYKEEELTQKFVIYNFKPINNEPLLIPWGKYEMRYYYFTTDSLESVTILWYFKSLKDTLFLP